MPTTGPDREKRSSKPLAAALETMRIATGDAETRYAGKPPKKRRKTIAFDPRKKTERRGR